MKTLATAIVTLFAVLVSTGSVAHADSLCCTGWEAGSSATCLVKPGGCGTSKAIDITQDTRCGVLGGDAGGSAATCSDACVIPCSAGSTRCTVYPALSCCNSDCRNEPQCLIGSSQPFPSCCSGFCGSSADTAAASPLCALSPPPPAFEACCQGDTIVAAQPCVALAAGFVDWTVSFGDAIPSPEPSPEAGSPSPDAAAEDAGSCTLKTCDDYYSQNACGTQDNGCGGVLHCDCQQLAKGRCSATPGAGAAPDFGVGLLVLGLVGARRRRR